MDREALIKRLMVTFLGEFEEHVHSLDLDLLALEKCRGEGQAELIQIIFRTFHSLKGAARAVDLGLVESACHRAESILAAMRDGVLPVSGELMQLLFATADALKDANRRQRAGQDLSLGMLPELLPRLDAASGIALTSQASPAQGPAYREREPRRVEVPAPPPPGITSGTQAPIPAPSPAATAWIRLDAARLDTLLAKSGELQVARRRAGERQEDAVQLREVLTRTRDEWRHLEKPLRMHLAEAGAKALPRRAHQALDRTGERLQALGRSVEQLVSRMAVDHHQLIQSAVPLEDEIRQARMLPFGEACVGLERQVRDLAMASGKELELEVAGRDVQLDRSVLEGLRDPLMHLVRNAADHGVELPGERAAAGKPSRGRIEVTAALRGGLVEVSVADDGRGLDLARIRAQALRRRLEPGEDDRATAQLIFLPGFTTAPIITELSGRGVGLDVVKHRVESFHGTVDFSSEPGGGTRFRMALPLTLTTVRALLVEAGGQQFAVPVTSVSRLVRAGAGEFGEEEGREVLLHRGAPLPVVPLAAALGMKTPPALQPGGKAQLVVVSAGGREVAFMVDQLIAGQEVVVKTLGARICRARNFAGATTLPSGRIALILNTAELVDGALRLGRGGGLGAALAARTPERRRRLLVAEDSVTTRSLEKSILEAAGYEVAVAVDGLEAWQRIQESPPDLLISDIEMPRLDGFGLAEAIRGSKRFHGLPIILVTALSSEKDRARGLEVGADAYLVKSGFDQRSLLEAISQLL
jgi:two-component system chemotaxis sensor kinase CheA